MGRDCDRNAVGVAYVGKSDRNSSPACHPQLLVKNIATNRCTYDVLDYFCTVTEIKSKSHKLHALIELRFARATVRKKKKLKTRQKGGNISCLARADVRKITRSLTAKTTQNNSYFFFIIFIESVKILLVTQRRNFTIFTSTAIF